MSDLENHGRKICFNVSSPQENANLGGENPFHLKGARHSNFLDIVALSPRASFPAQHVLLITSFITWRAKLDLPDVGEGEIAEIERSNGGKEGYKCIFG